MVKQRENIAKVGLPLCTLISEGNGGSTRALELAIKLEKMLAGIGTYERRYASHEERVLHRHLNLYRNKLASAKTPTEKQRWQAKVDEQMGKVREFEGQQDMLASGDDPDLDLDGL